MFWIKKYKSLIILCIVFFTLYSLISLVNHYNFRTFALDLGAYTNALFDYLNLNLNDSTVFKETEENLLADHFDIYLIIFSPLTILFKTYTLLIIQIIFILFGGIGIYKIFTYNNLNNKIALYATIYFYLFYGVFSSVAYDYHSNVIAASLVPWLFFYIQKQKLFFSSLCILFIIIGKENMSFWLTFILIGLTIEYRKNIILRNYLISSSLISFLSFIIITNFIIPKIANNGNYPHFNYSVLGNTIFEAFIHLITHPTHSFKTLFINHNQSSFGDFVKIETHLILLFSGLFFLFKKPHYLIMLIPIYFQKFFHNNIAMWGIGGQYNIEFAPIFAIGIFKVIEDIQSIKVQKYLIVICIILVSVSTIRTMDNTIFFTDKNRIRWYKKGHYTREYNVKNIHEQLQKIPKNAIVSAQSPFLPHLSLRDKIYQFPIIKDAEYIVFSNLENPYPININQFDSITNSLKIEPNWKIIYDNEITILQKK